MRRMHVDGAFFVSDEKARVIGSRRNARLCFDAGSLR